mgnify:CR=1 FL=1
MQLTDFCNKMDIENVLAILIPLIAVPVIALIGFFLKGLLKTIKDDLDKYSKSRININSSRKRFR